MEDSVGIIESLQWRYAVKKFDKDRKVDDRTLEVLLKSIQLTPTSLGLQPFKIFVLESNKNKILPAIYNKMQVESSSHVIVFCRRNDIDDRYIEDYIQFMESKRAVEKGSYKPFEDVSKGFVNGLDENQKIIWQEKQIYIALGVLLAECAILKVDSCPMEGFKKNVVDEIFKLEDKKLNSVVICPIGYRSKEDSFSKNQKVRLPLEELIVGIE